MLHLCGPARRTRAPPQSRLSRLSSKYNAVERERDSTVRAAARARPISVSCCPGRRGSTSIAVELDQALVADPEVVSELVQDDTPDLDLESVTVRTGEPLDWAAVDADLVGKHPGVDAAPAGEGYAPVQPEQPLPRAEARPR